MKSYNTFSILNIKLHKISREDIEKEIASALELKDPQQPLFIATVNPSFLVRAQKDTVFKDILNTRTTLNVADGIGLKLADRNLEVVTGVEITSLILSYAEKLYKNVLVVVREDSLTPVNRLTHYLETTYPKLQFEIKEKISFDGRHDVLLCALGEAAQEKFIADNLSIIKPKIAVGVGGAFDVLVGTVAIPKTKYFGWFFRLLANPRRLSKILQSVVVFPLLLAHKLLTSRSKISIM